MDALLASMEASFGGEGFCVDTGLTQAWGRDQGGRRDRCGSPVAGPSSMVVGVTGTGRAVTDRGIADS